MNTIEDKVDDKVDNKNESHDNLCASANAENLISSDVMEFLRAYKKIKCASRRARLHKMLLELSRPISS